MKAQYLENRGWNITTDGGLLVGFMPEAAVDDPRSFDPDVYPWEDSPAFIRADRYGKLTQSFAGATWLLELADGTSQNLTVVSEGDEGGTYHVRDPRGKSWTLLDIEDEARLIPGWDE